MEKHSELFFELSSHQEVEPYENIIILLELVSNADVICLSLKVYCFGQVSNLNFKHFSGVE